MLNLLRSFLPSHCFLSSDDVMLIPEHSWKQLPEGAQVEMAARKRRRAVTGIACFILFFGLESSIMQLTNKHLPFRANILSS